MGCSRQRMNFLLAIAVAWAGSAACSQDQTQQDSKSVEGSSAIAGTQSAPSNPGAGPAPAESAINANAKAPTPPPAPVVDPAAIQAARAMATAWGSIQSMSQEVEMTFRKMRGDEEMILKKGISQVDYRLTDGKWFMRSHARIKIRINVKDAKREDGAQSLLTGQILTRVAQGQTIYILSETANDTPSETEDNKLEATKRGTQPGDLQFLGGKPLVARLRRLENVHLGPEKTLDGKEVVVFETKSSNGNTTNRFFVETATGLLLKAEGSNKKMETSFTYIVKSTKFDVTFPDNHFELTLPEGVEYRDLTLTPTKPQERSPEPNQDGTEG